MTTTQDILQKGTRLQSGKYMIENVLGQGGFGITYLAEHSLFGKVALKELYLNHNTQMYCTRQGDNVLPRFEYGQFEQFKAKFLDEAKTLVRFKNTKGIVKVLDYFEENNTAYFSMEYINGRTLESIIEMNKEANYPFMEEKASLDIVSQLCEALTVVHQEGVLHRDIKPSNILVDFQGKATLIDFGIARSYIEGKSQAQTAFYSEGFSAPELKIVNLPKGPFTDIYSLASTLYYCLTNQPAQTADQREMEGFKSPKYLNPRVTKNTNEAIIKAIQLRASERPQSIEAFRDLLSGNQTAPRKSEVTISDELVKSKSKNEETEIDEPAIKTKKNEETIVDEEEKKPAPKPIEPRKVAQNVVPPIKNIVVNNQVSQPKIAYKTNLFGYLKYRDEQAQSEWYKSMLYGIGIAFAYSIVAVLGFSIAKFVGATVGAAAKVFFIYWVFEKYYSKKPYITNAYDTQLYVSGISLGVSLVALISLFWASSTMKQYIILVLPYHAALGSIIGYQIFENITAKKPIYLALLIPFVIEAAYTYLSSVSLLIMLGLMLYGGFLFHQSRTKI